MCFQTEPTGFSKNEYFMHNKGFTGNTWYWKQGNNQEQQNNKLGLQKKQKDLTMITNTISNATSIESTTVGIDSWEMYYPPYYRAKTLNDDIVAVSTHR